MKKEDKKVPLYINYFKNWTNENDITMTIIADKSQKILIIIINGDWVLGIGPNPQSPYII